MVDLIKVLDYVQQENGNGPVTVHCRYLCESTNNLYKMIISYSNGVGRSGTFCALLTCINQFKQEQIVDVFQNIQIMRSQRPGLVENTVCLHSMLYVHCASIPYMVTSSYTSTFLLSELW